MYSLKGVYDFTWLQEGLAVAPQPAAIVDVGGSHGLALRDAVRNNTFIPADRYVLFNFPEVIENTKKNVGKNVEKKPNDNGDLVIEEMLSPKQIPMKRLLGYHPHDGCGEEAECCVQV